jgi:hypothetical protein
MPMPAATGLQNLNYLGQPNIAREFETSLNALVQTVKPEDMGVKFPYDPGARTVLPSVYATAVQRSGRTVGLIWFGCSTTRLPGGH